MSQIILDSANDLIQGDFDNATLSQRTRLQTSTVNATTGVYVVPNGTATSASVQISNAADPTNASKVVLATNGSTDTQIVSGANGSGTYLPLSIYTNNDIRLQVNNSGALGVRTGPGTVGFGTSGQFLTSNGSGAGVSWTTAPTPPSPQLQTEVFTAPGTWTKPASATQVKVLVIAGGGGGNTNPGPAGGVGGMALVGNVPVSAPVSITVGAGGTGGTGGAGSPGGTSSFGSAVSCTGGSGGSPGGGTPGSATVSSGSTIRTPPNTAAAVVFTYLASSLGAAGSVRSAPNPAATAYSITGTFGAGMPGPTGSGLGGQGTGGIGGAVVVEFVG